MSKKLMQKSGHRKWRGHPYALYLRGGPRNWNPCNIIRMLPRQNAGITMLQREPSQATPRY